jgi:hypothetical protein
MGRWKGRGAPSTEEAHSMQSENSSNPIQHVARRRLERMRSGKCMLYTLYLHMLGLA